MLSKENQHLGIPVISAYNIKNFQLVRLDKVRFTDKETFEKWMPEKLKKGDVLLTSEGATLGQVAYFNMNKIFCMAQRLFAIRTNQNKLHSKFLYYYLISSNGQKEIFKRATGSTATGIRQTALLKIEINYPEYDYQKQIADILSNIDSQIHNEKLHILYLQVLKRGLMQNLLTGKIRVKF